MRPHRWSLLTILVACAPNTNPGAVMADGCDTSIDTDEDGLDDCAENAIGTDPLSDDTDNDGVTDATEVDCSSDPLDSTDACYACGWGKRDPGNLTATGSDFGDTIGNVQLTDQCGETITMWDFYGEYHVLYLTAAW